MWGSATPYYKLDGCCLELSPAPFDTKSRKTPAYLGRRIQHHDFEVETVLTLPNAKGERAGLLVVKNEQRQIMFSVGSHEASLYRIGKGSDELVASCSLDEAMREICLRVIHQDGMYGFFYKSKDEESWKCLAENVPSDHVSTQRGGFTGTTIGLFVDKVSRVD